MEEETKEVQEVENPEGDEENLETKEEEGEPEAAEEEAKLETPVRQEPKKQDAKDSSKREVVDCFCYFDRRKQGKLNTSMLEELVTTLGVPFPGPERKDEVLNIADPSGIFWFEPGSGYFTLNGFIATMDHIRQGTINKEDIETAFRLFDKSNQGRFGLEKASSRRAS
jgi:Ca2+-binding EF-hand superfamily protein